MTGSAVPGNAPNDVPDGGTDGGTDSGWRRSGPDIAAGLVVAFLGVLEVVTTRGYYEDARAPLVLMVLGMAAAAGMCRRLPGLALALVWGIGMLQLLTGTPVLFVQAAVVVVAFGTARWGSTLTVWLSGLSIPAVSALAVAFVASGFYGAWGFAGLPYERLLEATSRFGRSWVAGAAVSGIALLAVPWLAGLALRFLARAQGARVSQVAAEADAAEAARGRDQAEEIARLREEQARLARDVHDVVGHSLAVILAQAQSAQYLPDDPAPLKETLATIASSARTSLQDVRQVLATTRTAAPQPGGLDELVARVRASGHHVDSTEIGLPRPLPPEVATVAFRVLQEMLTNAIRHGRHDVPVEVERHWEGELRLEVRNAVAEARPLEDTQPLTAGPPDPLPPPTAALPGRGLEGMRRRLESVGGRLDVRRREGPDGPTFTATAWLPTGSTRG